MEGNETFLIGFAVFISFYALIAALLFLVLSGKIGTIYSTKDLKQCPECFSENIKMSVMFNPNTFYVNIIPYSKDSSKTRCICGDCSKEFLISI